MIKRGYVQNLTDEETLEFLRDRSYFRLADNTELLFVWAGPFGYAATITSNNLGVKELSYLIPYQERHRIVPAAEKYPPDIWYAIGRFVSQEEWRQTAFGKNTITLGYFAGYSDEEVIDFLSDRIRPHFSKDWNELYLSNYNILSIFGAGAANFNYSWICLLEHRTNGRLTVYLEKFGVVVSSYPYREPTSLWKKPIFGSEEDCYDHSSFVEFVNGVVDRKENETEEKP